MISEQRQTRAAIQTQTNAIKAIDLNVNIPAPIIQQVTAPIRRLNPYAPVANANPQNNAKRWSVVTSGVGAGQP